MSSVVLSGDTSGSITLDAPAVAGSSVQTLVAATGTLAPLIAGTAQTASGSSVDFTGIPSWVKRITVMYQGLSLSGTSGMIIQLIASGTPVTSGYTQVNTYLPASTTSTSVTTSIFANGASVNASVVNGAIYIHNINSNSWVANGIVCRTGSETATQVAAGSITLGSALTGIRVTSGNGTDTFDAGTINILYE
jgi:hypothetical protein